MEENKIPDFLFQMLVNQYGEKNTDEILDGYKQKRFTTLRVNTIKSNVEEIKNELKNNKIEFQRVEWFESAFVLKNANEQDIKELDIYKQGKIYNVATNNIGAKRERRYIRYDCCSRRQNDRISSAF